MQTNAISLYYSELTFVCCIPLLVALIVFYLYTGLSFSDMRNRKEENIVTYFDDHQWIKINRQKTSDYYIAIQRSTD